VLLVVAALVLINTHSKTELHLTINNRVGIYFFDRFFYYITYLGDGLVAVFLLAAIFIFNVRLGVVSLLSFLLASLTSITLKELFFDDENRPFFVFTYYEHLKLKLVDGLQPFIHNSFPSGHATQAFAIFSVLMFYSQKNFVKFLFLFLALLTAFSRVYLSQHWLSDITAGSCIGMFYGILFHFLIIEKNKIKILNRNIFQLSQLLVRTKK